MFNAPNTSIPSKNNIKVSLSMKNHFIPKAFDITHKMGNVIIKVQFLKYSYNKFYKTAVPIRECLKQLCHRYTFLYDIHLIKS